MNLVRDHLVQGLKQSLDTLRKPLCRGLGLTRLTLSLVLLVREEVAETVFHYAKKKIAVQELLLNFLGRISTGNGREHTLHFGIACKPVFEHEEDHELELPQAFCSSR